MWSFRFSAHWYREHFLCQISPITTKNLRKSSFCCFCFEFLLMLIRRWRKRKIFLRVDHLVSFCCSDDEDEDEWQFEEEELMNYSFWLSSHGQCFVSLNSHFSIEKREKKKKEHRMIYYHLLTLSPMNWLDRRRNSSSVDVDVDPDDLDRYWLYLDYWFDVFSSSIKDE